MTNAGQRQHLKRPVPCTGELIPAVGLGTYQRFEAGTTEDDRSPLREVLRLFVHDGGSVVDSSPMYGSAESAVGDLASALGVRDSLFLGLRTTVMDLMQVHNLVDSKIHLATIRAWQEAGRIRYSGITHYFTAAFGEIERLMKSEKPDFVQI